jgi:hypothetical protein
VLCVPFFAKQITLKQIFAFGIQHSVFELREKGIIFTANISNNDNISNIYTGWEGSYGKGRLFIFMKF